MTSETAPRHGRVREFFTPGRVVFLVVAVLTLVFVFENTGQTKIRLLVPEVTMPLWVALAATLLLGVAGGFYLGHRGLRRRYRREG
ncbi:DUF1049 domain-containing protein [Streptomyces otsuchiensis]|uniref:DUF1049 domain-containing protein n=2 Tax=Streptomyces TaxID=1883 RepID=UPI001030D1A5|nr:DUF1049 domain-containing protein [Streptomyces otsuchiensis]